LIGRKYTPEEEVEAVVKSIDRWLPEHADATLAVLVPRNQRGVDVIDALKRRNIDFVELLGSTSSTRQAAGRLGDVVSTLADPQSSARLAKAYLAWRRDSDETANDDFQRKVAQWLSKCAEVETFASPRTDRDWLASLASPKGGGTEVSNDVITELEEFRAILRRWQATTLLPIDQMILTLGQDLFSAPNDLALAHKLALVLHQASRDHADWRLPELNGELSLIARNERRFLGFSEDDAGFDPSQHASKVVVTTMHKAKGLEWDRVYLMSVNNYDFPSLEPNDRYISEKWFVRDNLNLEAETLAQLQAVMTNNEYAWYEPGLETRKARLDYVRERLRLLYVGITRAKKELILTWNTGRTGEQTQALPFSALQGWLETKTT
jgi:DNA helicase-2/ATP-dependent DNA helicase PcrA